MNLNQLAEKTLKHHVESDNGAGELVDYIHKHSGVREYGIKCYPQQEIKEDTNTSLIQNSVTFHALFLEYEPKKSDIIKYDDIEWRVEAIKRIGNYYDITSYENTHNMGRR